MYSIDKKIAIDVYKKFGKFLSPDLIWAIYEYSGTPDPEFWKSPTKFISHDYDIKFWEPVVGIDINNRTTEPGYSIEVTPDRWLYPEPYDEIIQYILKWYNTIYMWKLFGKNKTNWLQYMSNIGITDNDVGL